MYELKGILETVLLRLLPVTSRRSEDTGFSETGGCQGRTGGAGVVHDPDPLLFRESTMSYFYFT